MKKTVVFFKRKQFAVELRKKKSWWKNQIRRNRKETVKQLEELILIDLVYP